MDKPLTSQEHEIIQQLILDRWNPHRINMKIANHFGLSVNQVRHIRRKPHFQAEYTKQLAIYKDSFDDVRWTPSFGQPGSGIKVDSMRFCQAALRKREYSSMGVRSPANVE